MQKNEKGCTCRKKCLKTKCCVRWVDLVRNDSMRARCGCKCSLIEKINQGVWKYFRHREEERRKAD